MPKFNLNHAFLLVRSIYPVRPFVFTHPCEATFGRMASICIMLILLLGSLMTSGCATIISGRSDFVTVSTDASTPIKATLQTSKVVKHVELPAEDVKLMRTSEGVKVTLLDKCYKVIREEVKVNTETVDINSNNNTGNATITLEQSNKEESSKPSEQLADNEYMINSNLNPAMLWNLVFFPGGTVVGVLIDLASSAIFSYDEYTVIPVKNICEQDS